MVVSINSRFTHMNLEIMLTLLRLQKVYNILLYSCRMT
nr:MAG TPA: Prolyl 4-Hydroxylase alpha-subunit, N-terminal region [Caudoviricetes sp.]